jgi:hypothetical protein
MVMALPTRRFEVDLDISPEGRIGVDLDHGVPKVRASPVIPKTGMEDSHWSAVDEGEVFVTKPLVLPHELKEAFAGSSVTSLTKKRNLQRGRTPRCVR